MFDIKQWYLDHPGKRKQYYKNNIEYYEQYYLDNKAKIDERNRVWAKNNPKKHNEQQKQWAKNNPKKIKEYSSRDRFRNHGLSHEDWQKMWNNQDGKCAICGKSFSCPKDGYIDHNHETGKVRGLLCRNCNLGIGFLKDDPEITRKATKYLFEEVKI